MIPQPRARWQTESDPPYPLNLVVLRLPGGEYLTLQDVLEGIHIFGAKGAGKTSGSGKTLAHAFLRAGFGGLVLCAKPDEARRWVKMARDTGRDADLTLFGPEHRHGFNFIDEELRREGPGGGSVANTYQVMQEAIETVSQNKVIGGDLYWRQKRGEVIQNLLQLAVMTGEPLQWTAIASMLHSLPRSPEEVGDPRWREQSYYARTLRTALERLRHDDYGGHLDLEMIDAFASDEFARLDPEPRSSVVSMVTALADKFLRAPVRDLFMGETTVRPEDALNGRIIVMDMATSEYGEPGHFSQLLFKNAFQRAALRRKFTPNDRPAFLWADEAHTFTSHFDFIFQTLDRESGVATVYLSQNVQNYYHAMGDGSHAAAKALLGGFGLKIYHANGEPETNRLASDAFGTHIIRQYGGSEGWSSSSSGWNSHSQGYNHGNSWSEHRTARVEPHEFTELRRGGPHGYTEAILFRTGQPFRASGTNHLRVRFPQTPKYRGA